MTFNIADRMIGPDYPTFVIAELSGNHGGDLNRAKDLIHLAKESGADAVKLQTYTADTLTLDSPGPRFMVDAGTLWQGRTLYDLYTEASTPWEWLPDLLDVAREAGIVLFSTPFDEAAVDLLHDYHVPAFKIASFELVHVELIRYAASKGKPLIISTGMGTISEIDLAVKTARQAGAHELALLHCNSAYPAPVSEMNLRTLANMAQTWEVQAGLSDHTLGSTAAVAAVALGARIIEKHFTRSRSEPSPDAAFSLEPPEFAALVRSIRDTEQALGTVHYGPTPSQTSSAGFRRSLFVVEDMSPGDRFDRTNVRCIRPGDGLEPRLLALVIGRTANQPIARGTPLSWDLVGGVDS